MTDRLSMMGAWSPGRLGDMRGGAAWHILAGAAALALYAHALVRGRAKIAGVAQRP